MAAQGIGMGMGMWRRRKEERDREWEGIGWWVVWGLVFGGWRNAMLMVG
jgi:hypothetical protein